MNNLHRELAPISSAAWASIEDEARRSFTLNLAGRRVTDVTGPGGATLAAVGTGHLSDIAAPADGVIARARLAQPMVELRAPFTVGRPDVDDIERGAKDPDWQPLKDGARTMAFAEDGAVFDGYPAGGIQGIRPASPYDPPGLPADVRGYPDVVSAAETALRLAGVGGPYALLLSASAYTAVSTTSDHGYPVLQHLTRVVDGDIIWAPAIDGAILLSVRGGDYELHLGQDLSIGYTSHDADTVRLYLQESLTFLVCTPEAGVQLRAKPAG